VCTQYDAVERVPVNVVDPPVLFQNKTEGCCPSAEIYFNYTYIYIYIYIYIYYIYICIYINLYICVCTAHDAVEAVPIKVVAPPVL